MQIFSNINDIEKKKRIIALGNFDGLHMGHQKVIENAVKYSDGSCVTVLHFVPHPYTYFTGKSVQYLMQKEIFFRELEKLKVNELIMLSFDMIADMSPERFIDEFLIEKLYASAVSCGYNYTFGKEAAGNSDTLYDLCTKLGIRVYVSECTEYEHEPISATRIRNCIISGNVEDAEAMMGRPFCFKFEVSHGDHRGRLLGSPTINQEFPEDFVKPKFGVYASASFVDGEWKPSVTNFGIRPTVEIPVPRAETYILGYSGDLYGKCIEVALLEFTRGEIKFNDLAQLSMQIASDSQSAKKIFAGHRTLNDPE